MIKEEIKKGIIFGISTFFTIFLCFIGYAAITSVWTNTSELEVTNESTLTSTSWNKLLGNFEFLKDNTVLKTGDETIGGVKTFSNNSIFNGNVGIGSSNPQAKLDVNGVIRSSQNPHIFGSLTKTDGVNGNANNFHTVTSRGGMNWSGDRINITIPGVYIITFNTISNNNTGRYDAQIMINGLARCNILNEDNGSGHHQKSCTITNYLNSGDYIQFLNTNWYDNTNTNFHPRKVASVSFIN